MFWSRPQSIPKEMEGYWDSTVFQQMLIWLLLNIENLEIHTYMERMFFL